MTQIMKRLLAAALAAVMPLSAPCCAEAAEILEAEAVEYVSCELGEIELGGDAGDGSDIVLTDEVIVEEEAPAASEDEPVAEADEPVAEAEVPVVEEEPIGDEASEGIAFEEAEAPVEEEPVEGEPDEEVPVEEAPELNETALELGVKETFLLTVAGAGEIVPVFKTSKKSVATVNASGKITAKAVGTATITAIAGDVTLTCAVRVRKAPSYVKLSSKTLKLGVGEVRALSVKLPSKTASHKRTFTTSNANVATVDEAGTVTPVGVGKATVKVKTFNGKTASCTVTVCEAPTSIELSVPTTILGVGEKTALSAAVNSGSAGAIAISVDDAGVASLDGKTLKGVAPGVVRITAETYNGVKSELAVTVVPAPDTLTLPGTIYVGLGEKLTIEPGIPEGTHASFTYKMKTKYIASVSASGVIKGKERGSNTLTVKTHNGLTAKAKVVVCKAPKSVGLAEASVSLPLGEQHALEVILPSGTASALTYTTDDPSVARVDEDGVVTAVGRGTATIAVKTFNGKTATCTVDVGNAVRMPDAPANVSAAAIGPTSIEVSWDGDARSDGYRVFVRAPGGSTRKYATYPAGQLGVILYGFAPGGTVEVCVTAYNEFGETARAFHTVVMPEEAAESLTMSAATALMDLNDVRAFSVTVEPEDYVGSITWGVSAPGVVEIAPDPDDDTVCVVTALEVGVATVFAATDSGASAAVTVNVTDTSDLSAEAYEEARALAAQDESLINDDAGVIWTMIANRLGASGVGSMVYEGIQGVMNIIRSAADELKQLFVYSFGEYNVQVSDATSSNYDPNKNMLTLKTYSGGTLDYTTVLMHEAAHAIDYNNGMHEQAGKDSKNRYTSNVTYGNPRPDSINDVSDALILDVRALVEGCVPDALYALGAGVDINGIDTAKVVDAVMNYKTLKYPEEVMNTLTADEQAAYEKLTQIVANAVNGDATLPRNNGTMVWDAVEGTTNFSVRLAYGHSWLLTSTLPGYKEAGETYFYSAAGSKKLGAEPWAEFFASEITKNAEQANTSNVEANERYLPRTVEYLRDTFLPKAVAWFKTEALKFFE